MPKISRPQREARLEWPLLGNGSPVAITDIHCWHCCHQFDTPPVMLPISYDERLDRFRGKGVFCSFACTKRYNMDSHTHK